MGPLEHEIRRNPDAWEPWLVFADWLSEQGDVRGRLIALEHRRATATLTVAEQRELQAEIDELVAAHQASWSVSELPEGWGFEWRHGFIVGLSLPLDENCIAPLAGFLRDPKARLLINLRVHLPDGFDVEADPDPESFEPEPIAPELLRALFELDLDRVRALAFEYGPLGAGGAELLASWPGLARLRSLDLRFNHLTDAAIETLVAHPLSELRILKLQSNRIGPAGARALASAAKLDGLAVLDLRDNPIGPLGAAALADSGNFRRLEALYLYRGDVGPAGARALAQSRQLPAHIRRYWAGHWSAANERSTTEQPASD